MAKRRGRVSRNPVVETVIPDWGSGYAEGRRAANMAELTGLVGADKGEAARIASWLEAQLGGRNPMKPGVVEAAVAADDAAMLGQEAAELLKKSGGGVAKAGRIAKIGKAAGAAGLGLMLLEMLLGQRNEGKMLGVQERLLESMDPGAAADPATYFYEAMLPAAQGQRQMAERALMSQLSGGVMGPALARGERWT